MKIQRTFVLFCLVFLVSCNSKEARRPITEQERDSIKRTTTEAADIFGEWTICAVKGPRGVDQYNVCPAISFLVDHTAEVRFSGDEVESLIWYVREHKLGLKNVHPSGTSFLLMDGTILR